MRAGSWEETGSWRDCRGQSHTRFVHIVLLSEMKYVTFNCCSVSKSPEKIIYCYGLFRAGLKGCLFLLSYMVKDDVVLFCMEKLLWRNPQISQLR